jgi:ABC-type Mn2+/Zn2+ transport system permease subunit
MNSLTISHVILAAIVAAVVYGGAKAFLAGYNATSLFCTTCGHEGETKTLTRGNLAVEIVLWLCLIIPGLVYSVWRLASRTEACSSCGATTLVPSNSPVAVKMRKDLSAT